MKFWNKAGNDIYIFGNITTKKGAESDVTADEFVRDLNACKGDINLHINSNGGDIFSAVAIGNCIKNFAGNVTCYIEGICASAATLIACACKTVNIADNALFMIHEPAAGLMGFYNPAELDKVKTALDKIHDNIIQIYVDKTGLAADKIADYMAAETWFNAEEAVENKFADNIIGEVQAFFDNNKKILFVNKINVDCRNYDIKKIESRVRNMADILSAEKLRVKNIIGLKKDNKDFSDAIDELLMKDYSFEQVQEIVTIFKGLGLRAESERDSEILKPFAALIADNKASGVENVAGNIAEKIDENEAFLQRIAALNN